MPRSASMGAMTKSALLASPPRTRAPLARMLSAILSKNWTIYGERLGSAPATSRCKWKLPTTMLLKPAIRHLKLTSANSACVPRSFSPNKLQEFRPPKVRMLSPWVGHNATKSCGVKRVRGPAGAKDLSVSSHPPAANASYIAPSISWPMRT